jgi:hypothetical protein
VYLHVVELVAMIHYRKVALLLPSCNAQNALFTPYGYQSGPLGYLKIAAHSSLCRS